MRPFVSKRLEEQAREHAQEANSGHQHHSAGKRMTIRQCEHLVGCRAQLPSTSGDETTTTLKVTSATYSLLRRARQRRPNLEDHVLHNL